MNKFTKWWMTPKFPEIHLDDNTSFLKKWFFHPIKRRVARFYLKFLQKFTDIKVIAITGSAGKTTTKEILACVLKLDGPTRYSEANIDPIYNIPTTILRTKPGTKYLILEMGIEYIGEMDFYLWMAKPNIGVITNIFPTHLKFLKNVDGVFEEKSKLAKVLNSGDAVFLLKGDSYLEKLRGKLKCKINWVKIAKEPFLQNVFFASEIADYLGIKPKIIKKGISDLNKPKHRMNWIKLKSGVVIFDDTYNSNPNAFLSVLKFFLTKAKNGNMVAVVGDMLELGEDEVRYHKLIGSEISRHNFQAVIGVGDLVNNTISEVKAKNKHTKTYLLKKQVEVLPILKQYLVQGNYIFIKGSRSIGLDRLVDKLV